jgi:hypothetical protein
VAASTHMDGFRVNQALAQVPEFRDPENFPISWALIPAAPGR